MLQKIFSEPQKLVCIFAHPDDEAFGPGGTIAYFSSIIPVEIICVTNGDFPRNKKQGNIRRNELLNSSKLLGVKDVHFLGFHDGELSLKNYHEIYKKIRTILQISKPDTILTFDITGVSGHPDHIITSLISSFAYEKLMFIKNIYYFCISKQEKKIIGSKYFIYFPDGYSKKEVDLVFDIKPFFKLKLDAMKEHKSQREDYLWLTTVLRKFLKDEYFKIKSKSLSRF